MTPFDTAAGLGPEAPKAPDRALSPLRALSPPLRALSLSKGRMRRSTIASRVSPEAPEEGRGQEVSERLNSAMMIFVPASHDDARALRSGRDLATAPGCAATDSLIAALGPGSSTEEAEYAALSNAGVLAIMHHRRVAAARAGRRGRR